MRMLCMCIKPKLFLPHQIVVTRGDVGHEMYFIHSGEVDVLSEEDDDTPIATLKKGKIFGEVEFKIKKANLLAWRYVQRHLCLCVCVCVCELFLVTDQPIIKRSSHCDHPCCYPLRYHGSASAGFTSSIPPVSHW